MKKELVTAVVLMMAFCLGHQALQAEPVSVMLERGIYLEETRGDLDGAIEIYMEILKNHMENRSYAAKALYRIGQCYQKQGRRQDAEDAFSDVVEKFPDQKEMADKAMKLLSDKPQDEHGLTGLRDKAISVGDLIAAIPIRTKSGSIILCGRNSSGKTVSPKIRGNPLRKR